jgi:predicted nucleotide-binding protein (sugar kinase/HSP70/actin superfamily)
MSNGKSKSIEGRTVHVHAMTRASTRLLTAVLRSSGVNALITEPSDDLTLELGSAWSEGDECLPKKLTMGDYLKIIEADDFDPDTAAFFMPTAGGPCRFGQYANAIESMLKKRGMDDVMIVSPTSSNGYEGFGSGISTFRAAWLSLVTADILRKLLLKTRPYERVSGTTDRVYEESVADLERVFGEGGTSFGKRFDAVISALVETRERFRSVDADYVRGKPLVAVVGEIFCRHNRYSNDDTIRHLEAHGAEAWLADVAEWVLYTDWSRMDNVKRREGRLTREWLTTLVKLKFMKRDEHRLLAPFADDFRGYEEPENTGVLAEYAEPYLPIRGALGEMSLSLGRAGYCYDRGADGILDISPFSCMNGLVSEAVYPSFSRDHDDIPCRVFYFDGINTDLNRDIGIYMELVRGYMSRKNVERTYPAYFS